MSCIASKNALVQVHPKNYAHALQQYEFQADCESMHSIDHYLSKDGRGTTAKLPWIFPGVLPNFNGASGNIQGNLTGMKRHSQATVR